MEKKGVENVLDTKVNELSATKLFCDKKSSQTENELINLDDIELSDEDTWLYTAPKNLTNEEKATSPYKWLRKDIENPNKEDVQKAKNDFAKRMDMQELRRSLKLPKSQPNSESDISKPNEEILTNMVVNGIPDYDKSICRDAKVNPKEESHHDSDQKQMNKASDIRERARLQEESLKKSSSKFLREAALFRPKSPQMAMLTSPSRLSNPKGFKPGSMEALPSNNVVHSTSSSESAQFSNAHYKSVIRSPNRSPFGSTASLSYALDVHRSSLPNLNRGYYSLKPKKNKVASDGRSQCPLPVYPRQDVNGSVQEHSQLPIPKCNIQPPSSPYRGECQTLPSSYRRKSRNIPSPQRSQLQSVMSRRESAPSPTMCQRESMPYVASESSPCRKKSLPYLGSKRCVAGLASNISRGTTLNSRSGSMIHIPVNASNDRPGHQRHLSQSPAKRQPLSSVHNHSPTKEESHVIQHSRNQGLAKKTTSPAQRSGIPVPSSQVMSQSDSTDESWSQDLY